MNYHLQCDTQRSVLRDGTPRQRPAITVVIAMCCAALALSARADEDCFVFGGRGPASSSGPQGRVTGATAGLDPRILPMLQRVASKYKINIHVTSGVRTPEAQAKAMYDNWDKLERGAVYKTSVLSVENRAVLDRLHKAKDEKSFIVLAMKTVGTSSRHCQKTAIDVVRLHSAGAIAELLKDMVEVKEGRRKDIQHFHLK